MTHAFTRGYGFWDRLADMPNITAIRQFLTRYSREDLLGTLQQNDRNGCWIDELAIAEGMEPATKQDAIDGIVEVVVDGLWAADDPRRGGYIDPRRRS